MPWRVFDKAVVVSSAPAKKLPLSLVFTMNRGGGDPQRERFHIQVSVESQRRYPDCYAELEFPFAFTNDNFYGEVREKRTDTHLVLRFPATDNQIKILNPGNNNLMGFDFYVKRDGSQRELMGQMVRATAYVQDLDPISIEYPIAELCNEKNPTVFR